ncbi:MAG: ABC transporter ATP-binding protein [Deltaproteobacteria bacterium]|nr:MAG: ABC transporter ATP-binding protein [Deltaproteobacteria bacterium]
MSEAVLYVRDLSFSYGASPLLEGVAFEARAGEFVGILGPNGVGKSTLVHLCCGLLPPDAGRIEVLGRPIAEWPRRALARTVALVPQATGAPFPYTVEEMVRMGRSPHLGLLGLEGPADIERARAAMEATGTAALARRRVDRLSGGEWQRVLVARALAGEPRLLFCDEPTAHLDLRHQIHICDLFWRMTRSDGVCVVTVFHDLNLAAAYCDRVLLLHGGRVAAWGSVEEVLTYGRVKEVYGTEVWVGVNELTGARFLVPVAGHRAADAERAEAAPGQAGGEGEGA